MYFAPYGEHRAEYLRHHVVFGSSVRHAVLSGLDADTPYSIRMQSFSETAGVLSKLSNTVVKHTLGMSALISAAGPVSEAMIKFYLVLKVKVKEKPSTWYSAA